MLTTGYSGTPLLKKLGIKENMRVLLIHEPQNYFELLEKNIAQQICTKDEKPDFIHLFAKTKKDFETEMGKLKSLIKPTTSIWISWYKKSAGIPTDLTEDVIRNYALQNDLVDIKVCAVSNIWSGLKLVVPIAKRSKK
jgi:alanyl-tRNA synthetase